MNLWSDLRLEFQIELADLNQPLQELNRNYRGHLEKRKAAYQEAGILRAILAVDEEMKSFETAPGEELSSFPELKRLQVIYREQRSKIETKPSAEQLAVIAAYRKKAEDLATAWTKEGKRDWMLKASPMTAPDFNPGSIRKSHQASCRDARTRGTAVRFSSSKASCRDARNLLTVRPQANRRSHGTWPVVKQFPKTSDDSWLPVRASLQDA